MFSDLGTLRATLSDRIKPKLWGDITIVDHLEAARHSLSPVIYFEFTEFGSSAGGQELTRENVAATVDLVVTTPRTDDDGIAETEVDGLVLDLVRVIVQSDDMFFSTARKVTLTETGTLAWRITLTAITNIAPSEGN